MTGYRVIVRFLSPAGYQKEKRVTRRPRRNKLAPFLWHSLTCIQGKRAFPVSLGLRLPQHSPTQSEEQPSVYGSLLTDTPESDRHPPNEVAEDFSSSVERIQGTSVRMTMMPQEFPLLSSLFVYEHNEITAVRALCSPEARNFDSCVEASRNKHTVLGSRCQQDLLSRTEDSQDKGRQGD